MTYDNFSKEAIKKYDASKKDIVRLTIGVSLILLSVFLDLGYLAYRLISPYMIVITVLLFLASFLSLFPYLIEDEKVFKLAIRLSKFAWVSPVLSVILIVVFKFFIG